jgi:hypothetical protein
MGSKIGLELSKFENPKINRSNFINEKLNQIINVDLDEFNKFGIHNFFI